MSGLERRQTDRHLPDPRRARVRSAYRTGTCIEGITISNKWLERQQLAGRLQGLGEQAVAWRCRLYGDDRSRRMA